MVFVVFCLSIDACWLGDHEEGLLFYAEDFNPRARAALEWTKDQLNLPECPKEENRDLWNFVGSLLAAFVKKLLFLFC